jgi:hypothetical protein
MSDKKEKSNDLKSKSKEELKKLSKTTKFDKYSDVAKKYMKGQDKRILASKKDEKTEAKFENFLESFKGKGQDNLIESVKEGFKVCFKD